MQTCCHVLAFNVMFPGVPEDPYTVKCGGLETFHSKRSYRLPMRKDMKSHQREEKVCGALIQNESAMPELRLAPSPSVSDAPSMRSVVTSLR